MLLYLSMNLAKAEDNMKVATPFAAKPGDMVSVYSSMYDAPAAVLVCRGVVVKLLVVFPKKSDNDYVAILSQDGVLRAFRLARHIIEPGWE